MRIQNFYFAIALLLVIMLASEQDSENRIFAAMDGGPFPEPLPYLNSL